MSAPGNQWKESSMSTPSRLFLLSAAFNNVLMLIGVFVGADAIWIATPAVLAAVFMSASAILKEVSNK